ncbi:inositol 1,4,5-trisphosphate receptor-interacting protein-like 1 [Anolis carolinensis]|uniref:ITPRIP like 1 n=1 Tax=Anolis carolinensis TaxID=28377 RepID=H9GVE6_ANOCA|nr:PREDICTED: inositol 1,4,5-trisphosphate receptor-interacting protein-like 1 [Anolis carolinensis]|eukprot:XP_003229308.1 PREDICTED: inositol 1,4,5-trisphosphate receptor-interacting protein-like 1 [Anolis carolinensis]
MALGPLIFFAVMALVYHPLMVSDDTDPATQDRIQQHEELLNKEMDHLKVEFEEKAWNWVPKQTLEKLVASNLPEEDGTWDGWQYVVLIILVVFGCCRHTMEKDTHCDSSTDGSTTSTTDEYDDETDVEPGVGELNQKKLEDFYDHHVGMESDDLKSMCDFVESFVNDLLEEGRKALPHQNTLPLMETCIGVGSAFEGWHTQQLSKPFTVLVPLLPPKGHSFQIESSDAQGGPGKHGHILVEMDCVCKRERLLGDVVCFLHHPDRELSEEGAFLLHILCTSSHLDVGKTVRWYQSLVVKAWKNLRVKYTLDFTLLPSATTCRMKLAFRSGRTILVDITLGVQQGDSSVYLVTHCDDANPAKGTVWLKTFAVQELLFFKWVGQRVPERSCHLKCLQILMYLRESSSPPNKNPVLTGYHYKTCLMHLLLLRPLSDWNPENLATRLQEILLFLHKALQEKYLEHFLIGNISLPIQIPMPQGLRSAEPVNLFSHLAADHGLHAEAVKEVAEIVERVKALYSKHGSAPFPVSH